MNYYQSINDGLAEGVDYYQLSYNSPIYVNQDLFVLFSERSGNNSIIVEALDKNNNPISKLCCFAIG